MNFGLSLFIMVMVHKDITKDSIRNIIFGIKFLMKMLYNKEQI